MPRTKTAPPAKPPTTPTVLTMTVDEAAAALGINRQTAYLLVQRGELPGVRLGRRVLVNRAAVLAMFATPTPA